MKREVLNAVDAARFIGLAVPTLNTLRSRGGGPQYLKIGRRVIYRIEDLRAWLDKRMVSSTADYNETHVMVTRKS